MKINWILLALVALVCFSVMVTLISFASKKGVPLALILFGIFFVGMLAYGMQTAITTQFKFEITPFIVFLIIVMGLLSFVGNWAQFQATTTAPNPGLAVAIISLQAGVITLLALLFFKDKMTGLQILGLIIGLVGVILISVGGDRFTVH